MREAERLTPRQEKERAEALAKRGRVIQDQWNRRKMQQPPGRKPTSFGLTEADKAEARRNVETRRAHQESEIQRIRDEERRKRAVEAKEAKIAEKVARYESELRQKAGLPERPEAR